MFAESHRKKGRRENLDDDGKGGLNIFRVVYLLNIDKARKRGG